MRNHPCPIRTESLPDPHPPTKLSDMTSTALLPKLQVILGDIHRYRQLLKYRGSEAQELLDVFQNLLDTPELDQTLRRKLIVAIQRISKTSGLYPTCYELNGVVQESEHPIKAGGFADIYRGTFKGQIVCIKAIRVYQNTDVEHLFQQVTKEAILWGQLRNINLLPIYGLYRCKNQICLVAPWMEHGDINSYLKNNPQTPRLPLANDVAHGLSYLHANGIIHGDLKGPNILIDDVGRARVADFGISSISDPDIISWTSHSAAASKGGSVRWQAPELFDMENDELVRNSERSDVYAWSCVCYEIFVGKVPFFYVSRDPAVIHQVKLGARPARPSKSSPSWLDWGLTEHIWLLMEDCWKPDPDARPAISKVIERLSLELHLDERLTKNSNILSPAVFRQGMAKYLDATKLSSLDSLLANPLDIESNSTSDTTVDDLFSQPDSRSSIGIVSRSGGSMDDDRKITDILQPSNPGPRLKLESAPVSIPRAIYSLHNNSQSVEVLSPLSLRSDSGRLSSMISNSTLSNTNWTASQQSSSSEIVTAHKPPTNRSEYYLPSKGEPIALAFQLMSSSFVSIDFSDLSAAIPRILKEATRHCPIHALQEIANLVLEMTLIGKSIKNNKRAFSKLVDDTGQLVCTILLMIIMDKRTTLPFLNSLYTLNDTLLSMHRWAKKKASHNMFGRIIKGTTDHTIEDYNETLALFIDMFGLSPTLSIHENFMERVRKFVELEEREEKILPAYQENLWTGSDVSVLSRPESNTAMTIPSSEEVAQTPIRRDSLQHEPTPARQIETAQEVPPDMHEERHQSDIRALMTSQLPLEYIVKELASIKEHMNTMNMSSKEFFLLPCLEIQALVDKNLVPEHKFPQLARELSILEMEARLCIDDRYIPDKNVIERCRTAWAQDNALNTVGVGQQVVEFPAAGRQHGVTRTPPVVLPEWNLQASNVGPVIGTDLQDILASHDQKTVAITNLNNKVAGGAITQGKGNKRMIEGVRREDLTELSLFLQSQQNTNQSTGIISATRGESKSEIVFDMDNELFIKFKD